MTNFKKLEKIHSMTQLTSTKRSPLHLKDLQLNINHGKTEKADNVHQKKVEILSLNDVGESTSDGEKREKGTTKPLTKTNDTHPRHPDDDDVLNVTDDSNFPFISIPNQHDLIEELHEIKLDELQRDILSPKTHNEVKLRLDSDLERKSSLITKRALNHSPTHVSERRGTVLSPVSKQSPTKDHKPFPLDLRPISLPVPVATNVNNRIKIYANKLFYSCGNTKLTGKYLNY